MSVRYVHASPAHLRPIANRMGRWDAIECEAGGHTPIEALRLSLRGSVLAWTALVDGRPEAVWGVTPINLLEGEGSPWMLGTDTARRYPKAFFVGGARTLPIMLQCFSRLRNEVALGNAHAQALLNRWGFLVGGAVRERGGVEFISFEMVRP